MAYIYQIVNDINGKVYVGKTEFSVEKRFQEHCRDAFKDGKEQRPLYAAMRKYGINHFSIEVLEQTDFPEEREKFWIEQKRSFKTGYNATFGGDGNRYIDYDLVIATYKELLNQNEVARKLNISSDSVRKILEINQITPISCQQVSQKVCGKIVNQYDLKGNFIQSFPSAKSAAASLGKITTSSNGASSHITEVCKGKRKTAYGYIWKFNN